MLKNYFKIALRNLLRGKLYSIINITGLTIGTTVCILLLLFVNDEWTFDSFHENSDRIYRVWVKENDEGRIYFNTITPVILGEELQNNFPQVKKLARYTTIQNLVRKGSLTEQENIHVVDPSFLNLFNFSIKVGKKEEVFSQPHQIVLTQEMAQKYFGDPSPLGQTLTLQFGEDWVDFLVSGIIEDAPSNSSIQYGMLIPFENTKTFISEGGRKCWTCVYVETYALLKEGVDPVDFKSRAQLLFDERVKEIYPAGKYEVGYQPLAEIHLDESFPVGIVSVSDWRYAYILGGIALLILLLAAINFTTLAVGRSVNRSKEVGVRKVTGASRWQLMGQFWSEAILTSLIALGLGILLAEILLPLFNDLAAKQLTLNYTGISIAILLSFGIIVGLISGIYPALVLSGFSPLQSLRGTVNSFGNRKHLILRGLVAFQFVLSIILILCTFIMNNQMTFLQNKNLGFDKEHLINLPYTETPTQERGLSDIYSTGKLKAELLKNELASNSDLIDITTSAHNFGTAGWGQVSYADEATGRRRQFSLNAIDYNYLEMMGIDLVDGRNFNKDIATDENRAVIINEAMVKEWDYENPVGQYLPKPFHEFQIVGVTKDFNFASLHTAVAPLAMAINHIEVIRKAPDLNFNDFPTPKLTLKVKSKNMPATLASIQTAWQKVAPNQAFNYTFLDDAINRQYEIESRMSGILSVATALAIFIACLGLFGIATLTIARRTKEIGVRKVLGASTADILFMLNKHFASLVLVAALIATPIGWYFMNGWLADFEYRVVMKPLTFILAGLAALGVALLAVSTQSLRAALGNPVKALKEE